MPWALASGQYPGPPHNSSYFSTPLQSAVVYRLREIVPGARQEDAVSTREGQGGDTWSLERNSGHGITVYPAPSLFQTANKNEDRSRGNYVYSKQLYPHLHEHLTKLIIHFHRSTETEKRETGALYNLKIEQKQKYATKKLKKMAIVNKTV